MSDTKPPKRPRVRPISRSPGQPRIRNLKCFPEVYDRILEGWTLNEVGRFIQEIKKEATDITRAGLVAALQDFRAGIPPAELTKKRLTPVFTKAVKEVEDGLDELAEMERLYRLQMGRIEIDVTTEKSIKKLMPSTGQEVRIAKEILTAYADLKMDLGLSKRHIGQMQVDARLMADVAVRYNKAEVQEVMGNPQSRKKVLNLVERLLSRSSTSIVDGVTSPDVIDVVAEPGAEVVEEGLTFPEDDDPIDAPVLEQEDGL